MDEICFVTAFKKIKRSWNLSAEYYINHFLKLEQHIPYKLIVYVNSDIKKQIRSLQKVQRNNVEYKDLNSVSDAFIFKYLDIDSKIIEDYEYLKLIPESRKDLPEHKDKEYNLINHSKINFIADAKRCYPHYKFYGWVDFGRFNGNVNNIPSNLDFDMISHTAITCQSPHGVPIKRISPQDMLKENAVFILGASYVVPNALVEKVEKLYDNKLTELYAMKITDDDQNILIQLYFDNPDMFHIIRDTEFYNLYANLRNNTTFPVKVWNHSKRQFVNTSYPAIQYVTVSTKQNNILDILQKCVHESGDTLTILKGKHIQKLSEYKSKNGSLVIDRRFKIDVFREYLNKGTLKDDDIVLFTDAYDVGYQTKLSKVKHDFLNKFTKPIVFSAEPSCYPDDSLAEFFPKKHPGGNNYLNSGMFIGRVWALKKCLQLITPDEVISCDQLWWRHF